MSQQVAKQRKMVATEEDSSEASSLHVVVKDALTRHGRKLDKKISKEHPNLMNKDEREAAKAKTTLSVSVTYDSDKDIEESERVLAVSKSIVGAIETHLEARKRRLEQERRERQEREETEESQESPEEKRIVKRRRSRK